MTTILSLVFFVIVISIISIIIGKLVLRLGIKNFKIDSIINFLCSWFFGITSLVVLIATVYIIIGLVCLFNWFIGFIIYILKFITMF